MRVVSFLILMLLVAGHARAQDSAPDPVAPAAPPQDSAARDAEDPPPFASDGSAVGQDEQAQVSEYAPEAFNPPAEIWVRLRNGFGMPDIEGPLVRKWERWYSARPEYVERMVERSRRYLHYIASEVERRHLPMEVAILPMIESAYNPLALSRARALGIWQFIPATGKKYGLEQNWWFDERRDVISATAGALDYLETLYAMFGDWQLAFAAYNCGEGGLGRAIARNKAKRKGTDYASLKLPRETREYLPKLQAVKNILRTPEAFGLTLEYIPDLPYFRPVTTAHPIDVKLAAELAEMPIEEFMSLNPAYNRPVIGGAAEHTLLLPVEKAELFTAKIALIDSPLVSWAGYRLAPGERLEHVAEKFGSTPEALRAANGIRGTRPLPAGVSLLVPAIGEAATMGAELHHEVFVPPPIEMGYGTHRVRRGETLASIAAVYGATIAELRRWNRLGSAAIRPGQRLRIGDAAGTARSNSSAGKIRKTSKILPSGKPKVLPPGKKRV